MPPKKASKGKRKSKQLPKYPESTGKNPCGNTASAQIGLAMERPVAPSRLAMQPPAAPPPQPRPVPYVRSLQQGLPYMYDTTVGPSMASYARSPQQRPPQMNLPSWDMRGGPPMTAHPQFVQQWLPQMSDLPSRDMMAGPSTITPTQFLPRMAPQIPPSNQQSIAGPSTVPPTRFQQQIPTQSTTRVQTPMLNVEGVHQAVESYRSGLRMRPGHSDALVRVPSVRAVSRAAPYEAYRLVMAYAKPRPGELIRGEEFSTGVIRVVPGSSRAIRKPVHLRLPPVEPAGTGHIAQPGLGYPAISGQPLASNSTQPPPPSSVTTSRIVDSARNVFKRDFLNNLMVASNDLKDMAQRAFNKGVETHSSSSTMDHILQSISHVEPVPRMCQNPVESWPASPRPVYVEYMLAGLV
ncbi:uncharacterized protein HD556DRAFT_1449975 [Suillus plorans]|uniref:Uncharacterized protein n=1 Tax=Suillus plorans TaxID=116603 RepID=A0A9P7DBI3_9AGAM|nr:uncharacterized protein HD556DRAFT_1449975 [Suillus plorans]KAG1786120.1 hypothetical protein HD556DRAFT_1449975 [Suillus plorans]